MLDCGDMKRLLDERLPLLPPFRRRLVEVPLGLDYPYWIDDPDFDLDFHVRELALPAPGSDQQLAEQVARIFSRPLDRARPLWELYVIHGLESGQRRGAHEDPPRADRRPVGRRDHGPAARPGARGPRAAAAAGATTREPKPGDLEMLGRGLLGLPRYPLRALRSLPRAVPNIDETPLGTLPGAGTLGRLAGARAAS